MKEPIIAGGATIWARQTLDSEVFLNKPHVWFKIWFYLVNRVNHATTKELERGECFLRYDWICEKTKATKSEVDHCLRWMKSAMMLATRKATHGLIVSVNKYGHYQTLDNYYGDVKSDDSGETKAKQKRNKSDNIHKNDKNEENEKKPNPILATPEVVAAKDEVNEILSVFQMKLNPTINYGNKTQRDAVKELLRIQGKEKLIRTIEYAASVSSDQFAPIITTPYQLKEKMAQLIAYYQKQNNKRPNIISV